MGKLIEFKDVTISLHDRVLYDKLNLTINSGDRYIFLGPNGVGKSLLLEILAYGYCGDLCNRYEGLKVTGVIEDGDGNDLLDPQTQRQFAYAQQVEDFYENTTVREEAETSCAGVGLELDEPELDRLLEMFSLSDKKSKKIKRNVSFGEGKMIHLICVALKLKVCPVLLLDEPLNHLSFRNSQLFNKLINEVISKNPDLAIIMVSHCRAVDFTQKAMMYELPTKSIKLTDYSPYNCFADDIGRELGCE